MSEQRLTQYLTDLVGINSVNPNLSEEGQGERKIAEYIHAHFQKLGLNTDLFEVVNDRCNTTSFLVGKDSNKIILMNGHIDTVGVEGMDSPFVLRQEGDRLYGRGTYDMLAGCAIQMCLADFFAKNESPISLAFTFVCDEEDKSIGMDHLIANFLPTLKTKPILGIFMEPTEDQIGICHKGYSWYELRVNGVASHGSRPEEGVNAIFPLQYALAELDEINIQLSKEEAHPLLGHATLHPGTIRGGSAYSVIAAEAKLVWERRTLPNEDPKKIQEEVDRVVAAVSDAPGEHKVSVTELFSRPANHTKENEHIGRLQNIINRKPYKGMSYWADSALAAGADIPSILFGPAGHGAHAIDEWVSKSSMEFCFESLKDLILSYQD